MGISSWTGAPQPGDADYRGKGWVWSLMKSLPGRIKSKAFAVGGKIKGLGASVAGKIKNVTVGKKDLTKWEKAKKFATDNKVAIGGTVAGLAALGTGIGLYKYLKSDYKGSPSVPNQTLAPPSEEVDPAAAQKVQANAAQPDAPVTKAGLSKFEITAIVIGCICLLVAIVAGIVACYMTKGAENAPIVPDIE